MPWTRLSAQPAQPALPGRTGRPGDQRVIGVGDDADSRRGRERLPPAPGDQPDLGGPVHLVAAQVQQHDHPRAGRLDHRGQVPLVHLEHRVGRVRGARKSRDQAAFHVGTVGVGGHLLAERPDRRGHQPGRRGLAVGAGHHHDLAAHGQLLEQVGSDLQADDSPDHRAVTTSGEPRHLARRSADSCRYPRSDRKLAHSQGCYPATERECASAAIVSSSSHPTMNLLGQLRTGSSQPATPISPAACNSWPRWLEPTASVARSAAKPR